VFVDALAIDWNYLCSYYFVQSDYSGIDNALIATKLRIIV